MNKVLAICARCGAEHDPFKEHYCHENEPRSEYGNLPPELKAMQVVMDAIFPEEAGTAPDFAPPRIDIETAIMRAPGFDYLLASEIFAALQRRLELRYENLNPQVEEAMQRLAKSFDHVTG